MAGSYPSWSDSVNWKPPADISTQIPKSFDSFWNPKGDSAGVPWSDALKYKPSSSAKDFLDRFAEGLKGSGQSKYQDQAQQGGFQTGGRDGSPGANVGKIAPDISIYTPPTPYSPFTVQGVQGSPGFGGAIGSLVGTAASFIPGLGPGIKAALPSIGGNIGGMIG